MKKEDAKKRIENIRIDLEKYNYYYYQLNESLISDVEFDRLLEELHQLEEEYPEFKSLASPTLNVGGSVKDSKFSKVTHQRPMLSLSNTYNPGEVLDFMNRVVKNINVEKTPTYDLELKLDGLSISVIYQNGKLEKAVTRGDGVTGEDVTENILAIESIPKILKENISLEVRGEIVLPISKFNSINEERLKNGEEPFANPRNAAAGTLRQLDSEIVKSRGLDGYFYFLVNPEDFSITSHKKALEFIESLGIKTSGICENLSSIESISERIKFWEIEKEKLDFETDGLVIKLDDMNMWQELGTTTKSPRWAVAYKFPAKQITTILEGITWQVGRTGKITPVAELREVNLSGSNVKRASLHNFDEIERKDIRIGDTVFIEKAAEIIPQVVKSVKEMRNGSEIVVTPPTHCPACNTQLVKKEGNVDLLCPNPLCPEKVRGGIEYFVSRDGMNILGFGSRIVEKFIDAGYLVDFSDIYLLKDKREELLLMDKMGERSIDNLLENIEKSKNNELFRVIYALGIPFVGKFLAKSLAKSTKSIEKLSQLSKEELLELEGVGDIGAESIYAYFRDSKNIEILNKLKSYGVKLEEDEVVVEKVGREEFLGKTFLFTGKLSILKRNDAQTLVESLGGISAGSVNKKLDYLIVGEDAGSKLEKAEKLGTVKILTEEEFINMCK